MSYLRSITWRTGAVLLASSVAAGLGCQSILGIHDVSLDPGTGGSTGSTSSSGASGGASTTSSSSSASSASGTGGQMAASFAFAITDPNVNVPYGGTGYVDVQITPSGGFNGPVDVAVQGAPAGLVTMPLTIPAGSTTGKLPVGASAALTIGTMFMLTLTATSGSIMKTATVPAVVTGKPGDPDQTFSGGIVAGPSGMGNGGGAVLNDVREVPPGKILAGGMTYGSLGGGALFGHRLNSDGTTDTSFATTGTVTATFCGCTKTPGGALSLAREFDGTVLFVGWGNGGSGKTDDIYLFRYTNSGVFNTVQGDNGTEIFDLGGNEDVIAAALVPNSTNVIAVGQQNGHAFVTRFADRQSSGFVDTTFAAPNGYLLPTFGGAGSAAQALAIDAMGRVVVTGWVTMGAQSNIALLRLAADGTPDASFGTAGVATVARSASARGSDVVVQPDGTILVAADSAESGNSLLLLRFDASGKLDTAFGTAGVAVAPLGAGGGGVNTRTAWMARMLDGRVVVAGNGTLAGMSGPVLARFMPDGSLDPTFGTNGELAPFVGTQGALGAMSITTDGKLLLGGTNGSGPSKTFIARLWN